MSTRTIFAIIPAAGRSRRMRQPKLLLPWHDATIIDSVLGAWCGSNVHHVIVVMRRNDTLLSTVCERWPVEIVRPRRDPIDMKQSLQCALKHVADFHAPTSQDRWMVAPADLPQLNTGLINQVIAAAERHTHVTAPRFGGRQGHPVLLPWDLSAEMFLLRKDEGLQHLLQKQQINFIDLPAERHITDVDTPEEYQHLKNADFT